VTYGFSVLTGSSVVMPVSPRFYGSHGR
jgi:hypothetical protein